MVCDVWCVICDNVICDVRNDLTCDRNVMREDHKAMSLNHTTHNISTSDKKTKQTTQKRKGKNTQHNTHTTHTHTTTTLTLNKMPHPDIPSHADNHHHHNQEHTHTHHQHNQHHVHCSNLDMQQIQRSHNWSRCICWGVMV